MIQIGINIAITGTLTVTEIPPDVGDRIITEDNFYILQEDESFILTE
jgi:hypothetical protein